MEAVDKVTKVSNGQGDHFVVLTRGGSELPAKAVIIATGTKQLRLRVPGEKEYMMKGLCYSAMSYAPLFIDKKTVVVGDGDLALRSAAELATIAEEVTLVSTTDDVLATPLGKKLSSARNVTVLPNRAVLEVKGDEFARSVVVKDADGKTSELLADATFIEMALVPNSQMIADLVELDPQGRIKVDCANRTSCPGIFAAGDVASGFAEQVLVAIGEGAKAALSAYEYLLPDL
jgi:thioredoxin reductase